MVKNLARALVVIFILMNVVAIFHAYKFTHFTSEHVKKTDDARQLTTGQKIQALFFGVDNPRPVNHQMPSCNFKTIELKSNKTIECWHIPTKNAKGTVILFHGYGGAKSSLLDRAAIFREQGYNTFLVDFMGSGGSEGRQTTIGYAEAKQVKTCFHYLRQKDTDNIYLFGISMGAVAIMKAINDYDLQPNGIILECPFGSMYQTVCARFRMMGVPSFPMAGLLVFWGGIQNGFWAFNHKPTEYAGQISCPVLLMYGAQDKKVSREEIDEIFINLNGPKQLQIYQHAGHEDYLSKYKAAWKRDVAILLSGSL